MNRSLAQYASLAAIVAAFSSIYWSPLPSAVNFALVILVIVIASMVNERFSRESESSQTSDDDSDV